MSKVTNLTEQYVPYFDCAGLEEIVIFPDFNPGKGKLPTGTVAVFIRENHKISPGFLGPDIGCGMSVFTIPKPLNVKELSDKVAQTLSRRKRSELGNLGSGNHFIDFGEPSEGGIISNNQIVGVVHCGNAGLGNRTINGGMNEPEYLAAYEKCFSYSQTNRGAIVEIIEKHASKKVEYLIKDKPHNFLEFDDTRVTYRKGAVKLVPGELTIIPSSMTGDMVIVRAKEDINSVLNSMCHGTGRTMSRSEAKEINADIAELRKATYIPEIIKDSSLRAESPNCYRAIEEVLPRIADFVEVVGKVKPIAYIGGI